MIPEIRLFISQPMKDKTNEEILKERNRIIEEVKEQYRDKAYVVVVDSYFEDAPHDAAPLWFLGKSLEKLSTANVAYFADGWDAARGCKIEHECAAQYGIEIIHD
jgi:hypothetical protein